MTTSSPSLEARVARIEGIIEELRTRIANIEGRLGRLEDKLASLETSLTGRMQSQFQWTLGVMLSMWISIILAVLLKA